MLIILNNLDNRPTCNPKIMKIVQTVLKHVYAQLKKKKVYYCKTIILQLWRRCGMGTRPNI